MRSPSPAVRADGLTLPDALHPLPGQLAGLPHPVREPRLVELVVLAEVEVADALLLRLDRWRWPQRGAAEEGDLM